MVQTNERRNVCPRAGLPSAPSPRLRIVHLPAEVDANPYSRLFYAALERYGFELKPNAELTARWLWSNRREIDLVHFHWHWNEYYEWRRGPRFLRRRLSWLPLLRFGLLLRLARGLGYRLVWTVHEVHPHDSLSRRLDRRASRRLVRSCEALLVHDRATLERLEEIRRRAGGSVVPHGSYIGFYPAGRARAAVRRELGIAEDAFVFLCFGSLKPYKRIELLLEAFAGVESQVVLIVAGRLRDERLGEAVRSAAAADPRIKPLFGLVPDEKVAELFAASDAAVIAREDGWTSGSLILALSQGLPVVAPDLPAYSELTGGEEAAWLFEPGRADALRDRLVAAARDVEHARAKGAAALARAERLRWDDAAALTAALLPAR